MLNLPRSGAPLVVASAMCATSLAAVTLWGPAAAWARTPAKAPPALCPHISTSAVASIVGYQVMLSTSAANRGLYSCLYKLRGDPLDVAHEVNFLVQQGVKLSGKAQEEARLDYIFDAKAGFSPVPALGKEALFFSAAAGTSDLNGIILVGGTTEYIVQLYSRLALAKEVQLVKLDVAAGKDVLGASQQFRVGHGGPIFVTEPLLAATSSVHPLSCSKRTTSGRI